MNVNGRIGRLKMAVYNEYHSPEILPYEDQLVSGIQAQLKAQEETIASLNSTLEGKLTSNLYLTEQNRVTYLLREYFRKRLEKIEQFAYFIESNESVKSRLSSAEKEYVKNHANLLEKHFESVLGQLPQPMRGTHDDKMVPEPDLSGYVFFCAHEELGDYQVTEEASVFINKGGIFIMPYKAVQPLLKDNKVSLC